MTLVVLLLISGALHAQVNEGPFRSWSASPLSWSAPARQARLSDAEGILVGAVYAPAIYGIAGLESRGASAAAGLPWEGTGAGVVWRRLGNEIYREESIGIGVGGSSGIVSYGAGTALRLTTIERYGSASALTVDLSLAVAPGIARFTIGAGALNRPRLGQSGERLPRTLSFEAEAEALPGARMNMTAESRSGSGTVVSAGVSVELGESFVVAAGYSPAPSITHAGAIARWGPGHLEVRLAAHRELGWSQAFIVAFSPV